VLDYFGSFDSKNCEITFQSSYKTNFHRVLRDISVQLARD